jgi:hypothetical protein
MKRKTLLKIRIATSLHLIIGIFSLLVGGEAAYAAALTSFTDTMSRLTISTLSNHDIQFTTPTGVASGQTIILTFQSNFTLATFMDFTDMDLLDDTVNVTLANTAAGTTWGVATTTNTITFTNGTAAVTAGSVVRIKIGTNADSQTVGVRQITNTSTTGVKTIAVTGTFTDTGTTTVNMLANDQVALTAQVDGSLTFSISASSAGFGTLSASAARFASSTAAGDSVEATSTILTVGTNATNGFSMTLNSGSANQGTLTSGANTIATTSANTGSTVGSEQFGVRLSVFGGSNVTVAAPYAAAGFAFDSANFPDLVGSGTTATANATFGVRYIANIASNTEAGAYSATHTYVATANF